MENGISGISKFDANIRFVLEDSNWLPTAQGARLTATETLLKRCRGEYNAKLAQEQSRTYAGMTPGQYQGHMRRMEELKKLSQSMGQLSDLRRQLTHDVAPPPESAPMSMVPRDMMWPHEAAAPERRVANA